MEIEEVEEDGGSEELGHPAMGLDFRWTTKVPCAMFCILSGGFAGEYVLISQRLSEFDNGMTVPFKVAHDIRVRTMVLSLVVSSLLLLRYPQRVRSVGLIGCCLEVGHLVTAFGVQSSYVSVIYVGSAMLGAGMGSLYSTGVKLLLTWIPDSKWIPALLSVATYGFGSVVGRTVFPFLLEKLHVLSLMYVVGICVLVVFFAFSDELRLPTEEEATILYGLEKHHELDEVTVYDDSTPRTRPPAHTHLSITRRQQGDPAVYDQQHHASTRTNNVDGHHRGGGSSASKSETGPRKDRLVRGPVMDSRTGTDEFEA
mmetsp:Transcript_41203/g.162574  ORF Transcript_41203/g.162574 Transcript_41203/m.162574 type:complete len:313 (+) Transcript_41203:164-1102(+)|eukprot:CAMPEP_0113954790 /NCGR_PEP_ID=MMETSP0011_2-20120614/837_1 /TAXON_ID=101924 /ORGANISM="Rhodosorus marinus" /LENGTH=312 /DNA_ID=CAMNT_0000964135 /DNA_START=95 /DNA_END=1033 /DNA_ORIENTATION=- /assembly_acc=CAM_ASM_000156